MVKPEKPKPFPNAEAHRKPGPALNDGKSVAATGAIDIYGAKIIHAPEASWRIAHRSAIGRVEAFEQSSRTALVYHQGRYSSDCGVFPDFIARDEDD